MIGIEGLKNWDVRVLDGLVIQNDDGNNVGESEERNI